jgi:hypothetical protein
MGAGVAVTAPRALTRRPPAAGPSAGPATPPRTAIRAPTERHPRHRRAAPLRRVGAARSLTTGPLTPRSQRAHRPQARYAAANPDQE